jgi:hypothetical protein
MTKTISKLSLLMLLVTMFALVSYSQTPNITTNIQYTWTPLTCPFDGKSQCIQITVDTPNKLVSLYGVVVIWQYESGSPVNVTRGYDLRNPNSPNSIILLLTGREKGADQFPLLLIGVMGYEVRESRQEIVRY